MMDLKTTQRILMVNFAVMVLVAMAMVALYETEVLEASDMVAHGQAVFAAQIAMELVTIVAIPAALKMFSLKTVRRRLLRGKAESLLRWGTARINMLCLPMIANTYLYYQTMSPTFGYMAIILLLCLFFVYPSMDRCVDETEERGEGKQQK